MTQRVDTMTKSLATVLRRVAAAVVPRVRIGVS